MKNEEEVERTFYSAGIICDKRDEEKINNNLIKRKMKLIKPNAVVFYKT